jgi:glycosyltransferase involved in cell wall biosynthesis
MRTAEPTARLSNSLWERAPGRQSIIIATHDRRGFLAELFACLGALHVPHGGLELVIADDGSQDGTWEELAALVPASSLPVLALRLPACGGPSVPRNTAVAHSRGRYLLMTDDDCLPQPPWAQELVRALEDGAGVAQGQTRPDPAGPAGAWDRTIWVLRFSGLFETCNLGFDKDAFVAADGFPLVNALSHLPRGFGEDVLLGLAVERSAESVWVPDALVHHRWLPSSFAEHLEGRRRLAGFPFLIKAEPSLRSLLWHRRFLTRRTAVFDLAAVGVVTGAATGRLALLLTAVPWVVYVVQEARRRPGRPLPWRVVQVAWADAVAGASLVAGSLRHRRAVL